MKRLTGLCFFVSAVIAFFLSLSSYAQSSPQRVADSKPRAVAQSKSPAVTNPKPSASESGKIKTWNTQAELQTLNEIGSLPLYRTDTKCMQVSTYDTTGGNEDGFSGNHSFIRRNADSSLVIFESDGPGVIERIWTPTPTTDTLDFFIDDMTKPRLSICYMDLFSGKIAPFESPLCGSALGGNFCYYPILFAKQCRIVCRGKKMQFHQIQYRLFPPETKLESFSPDLTAREKTALERIKTRWNNAGSSGVSSVLHSSFILRPGDTHPIAHFEKGGRITGIELKPAMDFEGAERDIVLRVYWDRDTVPAIDCPVADFFGYAFGSSSMRSLLLGSKGPVAYCYFPMPFDREARVELIYKKIAVARPAFPITAAVYYKTEKRDPLREGKLYTCWRSERPANGHPHIFLNTTGKGHYVGTLLQAQGLQPGMTYFFEGDDSTVVDGEMRLHGTGSEDYFNGGWYAFQDCWDTKMSLPLHGALDYSLPYCRTGGYRLYLSDKISFEKGILHSIEHGPEYNTVPVKYTSLAFYYCDRPPLSLTDPLSTPTKVYSPDTLVLFPQLLEYGVWNTIGFHPQWAYPTGGESIDLTVTGESHLRISLKDIRPGTYSVYADFEANNSGARFSLWQRQTAVSDWQSTWSRDKARIPLASLGDIKIDDLSNTLTIRFMTEENRNHFFLNRLLLVKR